MQVIIYKCKNDETALVLFVCTLMYPGRLVHNSLFGITSVPSAWRTYFMNNAPPMMYTVTNTVNLHSEKQSSYCKDNVLHIMVI